jgi:hypothetical protein
MIPKYVNGKGLWIFANYNMHTKNQPLKEHI